MNIFKISIIGVAAVLLLAAYGGMLSRYLHHNPEQSKTVAVTILIDILFYIECFKIAIQGDVLMRTYLILYLVAITVLGTGVFE